MDIVVLSTTAEELEPKAFALMNLEETGAPPTILDEARKDGAQLQVEFEPPADD